MKQKKILKGLRKIAERPSEVEMPESCPHYDSMEKDARIAEAALDEIEELEAEAEKLRKKVKKLKNKMTELEERYSEED